MKQIIMKVNGYDVCVNYHELTSFEERLVDTTVGSLKGLAIALSKNYFKENSNNKQKSFPVHLSNDIIAYYNIESYNLHYKFIKLNVTNIVKW